MATQTTPVWALPYPQEVDPADVPKDIKALADKLDAVLSAVKTGSSIPGEIKCWPGGTLPSQSSYGHWVWCDGLDYSSSTYPLASANIASAWLTHGGKPNPGAGRFRVPDLRGSTLVGMDAMPGGARANRIVRAAAATQAAITGEEVHTLALAEMAAHAHAITDNGHAHGVGDPGHLHYMAFAESGSGTGTSHPQSDSRAAPISTGPFPVDTRATGIAIAAAGTGISLTNSGGGGAHENLQPTVFVPYICKLDD